MFVGYFAFLLMQYILVYPCVPLEEIENRPAMCVIANIYILVMFVVNASILPLCSSTIPTLISLRCLSCSFVLEAVGLTLNIFAVSQSLKAGEMFQVENLKGESSPVRVNVETYINFFIVTLLVFSVLATCSCLGLVIICERALEYIDNKVDRRIIKATHRQRTIFSPTILKNLKRTPNQYHNS
ncbi:hypothetical protein PVL30_005457 [Lodderomyces elongisporus]|uniref:uncharacterized protein n=1 Tax=Lodderomyces elongisporus TaxID=36914 RepID=UPI00292406F7|nr:uncharacterized protein PVL30_005457 [Lodderomyces elongisporus]WLF81658.1 hypothetical protein PVL30_005457 [Lodderomyces elongisporus]